MIEPLPAAIMSGRDRLGGEKHVAEVRRDALVVIVGRDVLPAVPVVTRRIVDEDAGRPERRLQSREGALQRGDVAEIAGLEVAAGPSSSASRPPLGVDVDEADMRALARESPHHVLADAGGAAGDEDARMIRLG